MYLFPLLVAKFASLFIQTFSLGSGSTWPGHLAVSLQPNFTRELLRQNKNLKIVVVAGTNGKTTTTKLLTTILESENIQTFRNEEGANLLNGIASSLVRNASFSGKLPFDAAIFEVDENALPSVLKQVTPHTILLLNIFRDQLDRYGEVHAVAEKWKKALKNLPEDTIVIANGDDPQINFIAQKAELQSFFFGVSGELMKNTHASHDVDSIYCPQCAKKLEFSKYAYSHLGDYKCSFCDFARRDVITFTNYFNKIPLKGIYNRYNINAALLTVNQAFSIPIATALESLKSFKPAFGRQEQIEYKERNVFMLLSKNPTGFNQSLSIVTDDSDKKTVLLVLNDQIPDGRDVSWIWDIDIDEIIGKDLKIVISGERAYDMALRLQYELKDPESTKNDTSSSFSKNMYIYENLEEAVEFAIESTPQGKTLYILPTYSAMLDIRKILTGKKLL